LDIKQVDGHGRTFTTIQLSFQWNLLGERNDSSYYETKINVRNELVSYKILSLKNPITNSLVTDQKTKIFGKTLQTLALDPNTPLGKHEKLMTFMNFVGGGEWSMCGQLFVCLNHTLRRRMESVKMKLHAWPID
jgi:hypothetical protein